MDTDWPKSIQSKAVRCLLANFYSHLGLDKFQMEGLGLEMLKGSGVKFASIIRDRKDEADERQKKFYLKIVPTEFWASDIETTVVLPIPTEAGTVTLPGKAKMRKIDRLQLH